MAKELEDALKAGAGAVDELDQQDDQLIDDAPVGDESGEEAPDDGDGEDPSGDPGSDGDENANNADEFTDDDRELLRLMRNPQYRKVLIQQLAEQEGILKQPEAPRKEEPPKKSLAQEVKELMGDEFDLVPASTWSALDRILTTRLGAIEQQVSQRVQEVEATNAQKELNAGISWLHKKYPDAVALDGTLAQLVQQYPPNKGADIRSYLSDIYVLAKQRKTPVADASRKTVQTKLRRTQGDLQVRGRDGSGRPRAPQTVADAVRAAAAKLKV